ncbi:MAG: sel1 repeat family protein [Myxococcales bacterium]|nr:sel1 repeat family protein [Myxococcales bacterium]
MDRLHKAFVIPVMVLSGCGTGAVAEQVRPDDPTAARALGEAECRDVAAGAEPLVVDWKPEQRGDLELAMKDGLAVVKYSCDGITVLPDCHIDGSYAFSGMTRKEQVVRLENSDELKANLPLSGAKIGGELQRGATIDVAMVLVGKRRTTWREPTKQDLQGQCDGATHFVRAATVGAFAMATGTKASTRVAAEVFGAGADTKSASSKETQNRDGDPKSCTAASPDSTTPPEQCGAAIRLVLAPIRTGGGGPPEKSASHPVAVDTASCPAGLVYAQGKCTKKDDAPSYQCKPGDAAECKAQCDKGHAGSCGALARLEKDPDKAKELFQKACDGDDASACRALGERLGSGDPDKAAALFEKACNGGDAPGCTQLGKLTKDAAAALALLQRGCDAGDPDGCASAADRVRAAGSSLEDQRRALLLDNRACQGGVSRSCVTIGRAYDGGFKLFAKNPILAQMSFRRACYRGDAQGCFELGRSMYEEDKEEAKRDFRMACLQNVVPACAGLVVLFGENHAVFPDPKVRMSLERSCMSGNSLDCTVLGLVDLANHNKTTLVSLQRACGEGQKLACTLAEKGK